jgi:hypothetical protein
MGNEEYVMSSVNIPVIIAAIAVIVIWIIIRKRNPFSVSPTQIVNTLLSDVRINLRLIDVVLQGEQIKRFSIIGMKTYNNSLDFLKKSVREALLETYAIAQDYNQQVTESHAKGAGYTGTIDAQRMKDRLRQSKSGLEDWLMSHTGTIEPGGKGGIFDSLLGR